MQYSNNNNQSLAKKRDIRSWLLSPAAMKDLEAVANGLMTGERLSNVLYQCVRRTPMLMESEPASLMSACKTLVLMGCEPDNVHGYLVPRKLQNGSIAAVPVPSARGLMRMARANGVSNLNIGCVYDGEFFKWGIKEGSFSMSHIPNWDKQGECIGVYCTWADKDGNLHGERMSIREIQGIMERSDSVKMARRKGHNNSPWFTDFEQMALKTVIKRAAKQWDLPIGIAHAMQDADTLEFEANESKVMRTVQGRTMDEPAPAPLPEPQQQDSPPAETLFPLPSEDEAPQSAYRD